jgi:hypothetical protein
MVCATVLIGVEKQEPHVPPASAEERSPLLMPAIRKESAEAPGVTPPATALGEKPTALKFKEAPSVAPSARLVREKSPADEGATSQVTGLPRKSTAAKPAHHRSWLSRAVGKIVHPGASQDGEVKH